MKHLTLITENNVRYTDAVQSFTEVEPDEISAYYAIDETGVVADRFIIQLKTGEWYDGEEYFNELSEILK